MVGVLQYILWLEGDMLSSFFIWVLPPQPLILKVATYEKEPWLLVKNQVLKRIVTLV